MLIEENTQIQKPYTWKQPNLQINTTINPELFKLAKENSISWKIALEFGIQFILAERNVLEYPECKLTKKIASLSKLLEEKTLENAE